MGTLDTVNLIAFVIGISSFLFGLYSHSRLQKVRALRDSTIAVIRNLAATALHNTQDIAVRGYLDGVILSCNVLGEGPSGAIAPADPATALEFVYDPTRPPFHSQGYGVTDDQTAQGGRARAGSRGPDGHAFLVFGPYVGLGCTGRFRAEFRLRTDSTGRKPEPEDDVASIDVFCQAEHRWLAYRTVLGRELASTYTPFVLEFVNDSVAQSLEFRVQLLSAGTWIACDQIAVRRITDGMGRLEAGSLKRWLHT